MQVLTQVIDTAKFNPLPNWSVVAFSIAIVLIFARILARKVKRHDGETINKLVNVLNLLLVAALLASLSTTTLVSSFSESAAGKINGSLTAGNQVWATAAVVLVGGLIYTGFHHIKTESNISLLAFGILFQITAVLFVQVQDGIILVINNGVVHLWNGFVAVLGLLDTVKITF